MNFRILSHTFSRVMLVYSVSILAFYLISLLMNGGFVVSRTFFILGIGNAVLTLFFFYFGKSADFNAFSYREAIGITVLSWIYIPFSGSLVYYISGEIPLFVDGVFESFSGFTTTGASILPDIEKINRVILLWRSFTHFLGGGGIIVLVVFLVPNVAGSSRELFQNEAFVPSGAYQERIVTAAKRVWLIYIVLNVLCIALLYIGGMPLFEAICHAFAALATGGFSPLNSSIATYTAKGHPGALYFEIILIVFMILGALPFLIMYRSFTGKMSLLFKDTQVRFFLFLWMIYIVVVAAVLLSQNKYSSVGETLRHTVFSVTSMMTTTGFGTQEFALWPSAARFILFFSMFAGGCAGSTGGGIKIIRSLVALIQIKNAVRSIVHPKTIYAVRLQNQSISLETLRSTNAFIVSFLFVYAVALFLLSLDSDNFETVASAVISCMSGVGPGTTETIGAMGNYAGFSEFSKVVLCSIMVLGRLEIIPVLSIFMPKLWTK